MIGETLTLGLSYDDVLLIPKSSPVRTRDNVSTETRLIDDLYMNAPIISANMDSVTESEMAQAMADVGGVGIIHRFMDPEQQAELINEVDGLVGGSVGIDEDYIKNTKLFFENGADFVCVDVAHGHMDRCVEAVRELTTTVDGPIMAGNVATPEGARDLAEAGAQSIKIGIGPGATCKTREVAGVGVPQFTAVNMASEAVADMEDPPTIVADGGVTSGGDIVKALMAGADSVMVGSLIAGCEEAPGGLREVDGTKYKVYRGMSTQAARSRDDAFDDDDEARYIEGVEGYKEYTGTLSDHIQQYIDGVKSGLSYLGAREIEKARENADFIRVTPSTQHRNSDHGVLS